MQGGHGFKLSNPLNEISLQRFLGHPETVFVKTPQYLCSSVPFCLLVTLSCALLRTSFGWGLIFQVVFSCFPTLIGIFGYFPIFPCQISQFLGQTLTPYFPHHFQRSMKRVCLKVGYPKPPGSPSYSPFLYWWEPILFWYRECCIDFPRNCKTAGFVVLIPLA